MSEKNIYEIKDLLEDGDFYLLSGRACTSSRRSIPIPPLRERGNGVLLVAARFRELTCARLGLKKKGRPKPGKKLTNAVQLGGFRAGFRFTMRHD